MAMEQQELSFQCSARYFQLGELSSQTKQVWIVCHGYGQLAAYFKEKFRPLVSESTLVVLPEGLHRFYLKSHQGRVGASWMTREDRLRDISNYLSYLNTLYHQITAQATQQLEFVLLGFSQGGATISRFAMQEEIRFEHLVLWAGVFPPDVDMVFARHKLQGKSVDLVYGHQDQFLTAESIDKQREAIRQLGIEPKEWTFDGDHDIDEATLLRLQRSKT